MRASFIALLVLVSTAARAEGPPPASCFAKPERWAYDRQKETLAAPGERFLEDMRACDPSFAATVIEAVRYQIQVNETDKFVRSRTSVMVAYGIAWALLALSALALWLRQRRLNAEIASLEVRLREAEKGGKA